MPIEVQIIGRFANVLTRGDVLPALLPSLSRLNALRRKPIKRVVRFWRTFREAIDFSAGMFEVGKSGGCVFVPAFRVQDFVVEISVSIDRIGTLIDA